MKRPGRLPTMAALIGEGPSASEAVLRDREAPRVIPEATHVVWTDFSVYEVDKVLGLIRRAGGLYAATPRVGADWRPYCGIKFSVGSKGLIIWEIEPGITHATETSHVIGIEAVP